MLSIVFFYNKHNEIQADNHTEKFIAKNGSKNPMLARKKDRLKRKELEGEVIRTIKLSVLFIVTKDLS